MKGTHPGDLGPVVGAGAHLQLGSIVRWCMGLNCDPVASDAVSTSTGSELSHTWDPQLLPQTCLGGEVPLPHMHLGIRSIRCKAEN